MQYNHTLRTITVVTLSSILALFVMTCSILMAPNILVGQTKRKLIIPQGTCLAALKTRLYQKGYLLSTTSFGLVARLLRYNPSVRPGAYMLYPNMSNWATIRMLRAGTQQPVKIVLHNVANKADLAQQLTKNIDMKASVFEVLLNNGDFTRRYGFNTENVLAMFIPNTYEVYWTITPQQLFDRMYKEYQRFWTTQRRSRAKQIGLTPVEVTILASIVQAETARKTEAPIIAGVYINRLRRRIALQSCPTLLYALKDPSARRVLTEYKKIDSPYNTHKHRGLPPGPINLPSIAIIDAVLHYTQHKYLYFSAKEDFSGTHYFTGSYKQHIRNARRYRKALDKAKIYR